MSDTSRAGQSDAERPPMPGRGADGRADGAAHRPASPDLSGLLTYRIGRLHAKLAVQAARLLAAHDGPTLGQWRVLMQVALAEPTTLADIARGSATDKGLLSRHLTALTAAGLVAQVEDARDHRRHFLRLTARGRALHNRLLPVMRARQERLTASLGDGERRALDRALDALDAAVSAELDGSAD